MQLYDPEIVQVGLRGDLLHLVRLGILDIDHILSSVLKPADQHKVAKGPDMGLRPCLSAFYSKKMINDVVNIGTDNEISILELAHTIIEVTGSKSQIVHLPALKEGDMTRRCPDNTKMKLLLNRPLTPLKEGIQKLMESKHLVKS